MSYVVEDRFKLPLLLKRSGLVGIELGVATGDFSSKMVRMGVFNKFFGVDVYADHHDVHEYIQTLKLCGIESCYRLLRMRFDEAIELFPDEYFDFVYIDGYAHTGEDGGRTIFDWYSKVKFGGLLCGHDYSSDWPLVVEAVNKLCKALDVAPGVTGLTKDPGPQDSFPSWFVMKTKPLIVSSSNILSEDRVSSASAAVGPEDQPLPVRIRQAAQILLGRKRIDRLNALRKHFRG